MKNVLSKNLSELLKRHDLSAAEISRRSHVPKSVIGNWINGQKPGDIESVKRVADTLGVTLDELCFVDTLRGDVMSDGLLPSVAVGELLLEDDFERFEILVRRKQ